MTSLYLEAQSYAWLYENTLQIFPLSFIQENIKSIFGIKIKAKHKVSFLTNFASV